MINNYPDYAKEYGFVVVTMWEDEMWFYGAYETLGRASEVADAIDGVVVCQ